MLDKRISVLETLQHDQRSSKESNANILKSKMFPSHPKTTEKAACYKQQNKETESFSTRTTENLFTQKTIK